MNEIFWFIPRKTSNNILSILVFFGTFVVTKFENDDDNNRSICSRNWRKSVRFVCLYINVSFIKGIK